MIEPLNWGQAIIVGIWAFSLMVDTIWARQHRTSGGVSRCVQSIRWHGFWAAWGVFAMASAFTSRWPLVAVLTAADGMVQAWMLTRHLPPGWFGRLRDRITARLPKLALGGAS